MPTDSGALVLATGHKVVRGGDAQEPQIDIISPSGEVELSIRLTPDGPAVRLRAARLEFSATESLSLQAPHVEIRSSGGVRVQSEGAFELQTGSIKAITQENIQLDGRTILLNCEGVEEDQ